MKDRSSEFKEKYESIDEKLLEKIQEETSDPATITNLKKLWVESCEEEEERTWTSKTTWTESKELTIEADLPLQDLPRRDPTAEGILTQYQR